MTSLTSKIAKSPRAFDVIVWGATGFTGQLTCKYIHEHYPTLRWAIGGRQREKLENLKKDLKIGDNVPVLTADIKDPVSLDIIFKDASVVLATAGPYAQIGTEVLRSCVRVKTNYCDLTAELPWIRKMIDELNDDAVKGEIRVVNSSGFDCIPSDLGCQMIVDEMKHRNLEPVEGRLVVDKVSGTASGGTIASVIDIMESPTSVLLEMTNPFYLNCRLPNGDLDQPSDKRVRSAASDNFIFSYDDVTKSWTMPYFMQVPDTRTINRSNSLQNFSYGRNFIFSERMRQSFHIALIGSAIMPIIGALLMFPFTRKIIQYLVPKPGTGPSEKVRNAGFFKFKFWGKGISKESNELVVVRGGINAMNGDPGYKVIKQL